MVTTTPAVTTILYESHFMVTYGQNLISWRYLQSSIRTKILLKLRHTVELFIKDNWGVFDKTDKNNWLNPHNIFRERKQVISLRVKPHYRSPVLSFSLPVIYRNHIKLRKSYGSHIVNLITRLGLKYFLNVLKKMWSVNSFA